MTTVVVLNTTYEPIHTTTVKHAIGMLWRGVAVVIEEGPELFGGFPVPKVLKLVRYVKMAWQYATRRPTCSTVNVLARDRGRCAYCGEYSATTLDHVHPRSRGGQTSWDNALAACGPCNSRKGNHTLAELGWVPLWTPWVPTRFDLQSGRRRG